MLLDDLRQDVRPRIQNLDSRAGVKLDATGNLLVASVVGLRQWETEPLSLRYHGKSVAGVQLSHLQNGAALEPTCDCSYKGT